MRRLKIVALLLFIMPAMGSAQAPPAPAGWRYPNVADQSGEWGSISSDGARPYHVSMDFNNDGLLDQVWIMVPTRGLGTGIFVYFAMSAGQFRLVQIDYWTGSQPQNFYIDEARMGTFQTACGKGYWDCAPDEPSTITIDHLQSGLIAGAWESASWVYLREEQGGDVRKVWLSD